jgi:hypothetical protein
LHDRAAVAQLVDLNQRSEWWPSFVGDARPDVKRVHLEEQRRHLLERWWAPRVDTRPESARPREPDQVAVVRVVIGVMVGDEDVAQLRQGHAGQDQLPGDTVAAVDDVRCVVDEDHLRRLRAGLSRSRAAARAEEDQFRLRAVLPRAGPRPECRRHHGRLAHEFASIESRPHAKALLQRLS